MKGSTLINRKLFLSRAEIVFLIGGYSAQLEECLMLFLLNLQPLFDYSQLWLVRMFSFHHHHHGCSVLAFRFSSQWKPQYGSTQRDRLDKEISFLFNYNFYSLFFLPCLSRTNTAHLSPVFFFPPARNWLKIVHCWHWVAIINYLNCRGVCGVTSKWKSWNISNIPSSVLVVSRCDDPSQSYSSGYRETQSRHTVRHQGTSERKNYEWLPGGEGVGGCGVGGKLCPNVSSSVELPLTDSLCLTNNAVLPSSVGRI